MSDGAQRTIDFARGEQLALLRAVRFSAVGSASGMAIKAVLRSIDDHGQRCWPAQQTIGAEAGVSRRTAQRAIAALHAKGLVCVDRDRKGGKRSQPNVYTIVWSEIAAMVQRQNRQPGNANVGPAMDPAPVAAVERTPVSAPDHAPSGIDHAPSGIDHAPSGIDHAPSATRPCATGGALSDQEAQELIHPPPLAHYQNATWRVAGEFLVSIGVKAVEQVIARAKAAGLDPPMLVERADEIRRTAELPPNLKMWRNGPATAAAWRLLHGQWPADGVTTLADWERDRARKAAHERKQIARRSTGELWDEIKPLRRQGLGDAEIAERLVATWPRDLVASELGLEPSR